MATGALTWGHCGNSLHISLQLNRRGEKHGRGFEPTGGFEGGSGLYGIGTRVLSSGTPRRCLGYFAFGHFPSRIFWLHLVTISLPLLQ